MRRIGIGVALWLGASGCTAGTGGHGDFAEGGGGEPPSTAGTTAPAETASATHSADATGSTGDEGTEGDRPKFDLAADESGSEVPQTGCQKIDFLFVVDDSGSMGQHQNALVNSFPGFIDAIRTGDAGQDHHIMVVTSATLESRGKGAQYCACADASCCEAVCETGFYSSCGSTCGEAACPPPSNACPSTYGAGRTRALDEKSTTAPLCPVAGGRRYLQHGQPALEETFACLATTATYGTDENNAAVLLEALSPELTGPGGCNDGFLRDDAILVVTMLSDASVTASEQATGDPVQWHDELVALKGNEDAIVVIGMFNDVPTDAEPCYNDGPTTTLFEFVELFGDNGFSASICQDSYDTLFAEAVVGIGATCDAFDPEG